VESPGTAPGSEPLITGAFIAIVWVAPSPFDIGADCRLRKRQHAGRQAVRGWTAYLGKKKAGKAKAPGGDTGRFDRRGGLVKSPT
jgi:hypothetical protein